MNQPGCILLTLYAGAVRNSTAWEIMERACYGPSLMVGSQCWKRPQEMIPDQLPILHDVCVHTLSRVECTSTARRCRGRTGFSD
ncbi:hypothetical protein F5Y12DRAFT_184849 [Xylaria sp. FL1777]|nr:hypothetical protein F5Y12DRAFT_184849 [Xylaria sp. FL1777]